MMDKATTASVATPSAASSHDPALARSFFTDAALRIQEAIDATARATVAATHKDQRMQQRMRQRDRIAHIDAAKVLAQGADFLAEAAYLIAQGAPANCPEVSRFITWGTWKAQEGAKLVSDAGEVLQ